MADGGTSPRSVWEAVAHLEPARSAALWAYVAGLFEALDLRELRTASLDVRPVLAGSVVHFSEVDLTGGTVVTVSDPPSAATAQLTAAYARLRHQNPVVIEFEERGVGPRPLAISDVADESSFVRSELYTQLFRGVGMRDQLVIPVPIRHEMMTVALCVGRQEWGFTDAEHVAAQVIQRSLRATYAALWQRESAHSAEGVTRGLLARSGVEVCVVDRFGEIIGLDGGAIELDPAIAEAVSTMGRLAGPEGFVRGAEEPRRSVHDPGRVFAEVKVSDTFGEPVTLQVLVSDDGEFWPVTISRDSSCVRMDDLRARGLTQRQAEVMALLLNNRATGEAALELGISPRTAEKHIAAACERLGVRSRTEALLALASGASVSARRVQDITVA